MEINDLDFTYQGDLLFQNLHFSIKKEEITLILGPCCCGKTTLIRLLTGLLPSKGIIKIDDVVLNKKNLKAYMLQLGVVFFDDHYLFLTENVLDELSFPLENLAYSKHDIFARIKEVAKIFKLENILNKRINELNNYEKVRVLIATVYVHNPKIIFLDNILKNLTLKEVDNLMTILNKIKKNTSIVITSSNMEHILKFDHVLVIGNKQIIIDGKPKEVLSQDNELSKLGLTIPPMIDLSLKLQFYGVLDDIIVDVDRMVETLWK